MGKQTHVYKVQMTCDGCKNAVQKVLDKQKSNGVEDVIISLDEQTVKVSTTLSYKDILDIIKKTGKPVEYVNSE